MLQGSCAHGSLWQATGHWQPAACCPLQRTHQLCVCLAYQASIARRAQPIRWVPRLAAALVCTHLWCWDLLPLLQGITAKRVADTSTSAFSLSACYKHLHIQVDMSSE